MKKYISKNDNNSGFKVPDHYFDSVEERIINTINQKGRTLTDQSPGFSTPTDYFENLDKRILQPVNPKVENKVIPLINWRNAAYLTGLAASVILIINLTFSTESSLGFSDLNNASIESYIIEEDLNAYELAQMLEMDELNMQDYTEQDLNNVNIEEYLIENINIDDIIIEQF